MDVSIILSPPSKQRKNEESHQCILCGQECDEDKSNFSLVAWENLKETAFSWRYLDIFGDVHGEVDWEAGPAGTSTSCARLTCKAQENYNKKAS